MSSDAEQRELVAFEDYGGCAKEVDLEQTYITMCEQTLLCKMTVQFASLCQWSGRPVDQAHVVKQRQRCS